MLKKAMLPITVMLVAVVIVILMFNFKPQPKKKALETQAVIVETLTLQPQDKVVTIKSQGTVGARTQTTLISEVAGVITYVSPKFASGRVFKKGEKLLTIDPTDYSVAVKKARAVLATQQARLAQENARTEQASKDWASIKGGSQASDLVLRKPYLAEAEANVKSAQADLERAIKKLERTQITAPFDGMVETKDADLGQYVTVGGRIGKVFSTQLVEIRLPITDKDMQFLRLPGPEQWQNNPLPVDLYTSGGKEPAHWSGNIVRMEGVIDAASRVHYLVAQVSDPYLLTSEEKKPPLKLGSFVHATIKGITLDNVYRVPRHTIIDGQSLFVVEADNTLARKSINVVHSDKDYVYIDQGIEPNDKLLTTNLSTPMEGLAVQVSNEDASSPAKIAGSPEHQNNSSL